MSDVVEGQRCRWRNWV